MTPRDCLFDRCSHPPCIRARHFAQDWDDAIDEDEVRFPRIEDDRWADGPRAEEYEEHYGEPRDDRDSYFPGHPDDR